MDAIDTLHLLAELDGGFCELNHGPESHYKEHPATDYIVQPFGYNATDVEQVLTREMIVPVCGECAQALLSDDWTLLYCFDCCSSQWLNRHLTKNRYRHHILWMHGCPECAEELNGLYFSDIKTVMGDPQFLVHDEIAIAA